MLDALIVHAVLVILVLLSVVTWTLAWLKIRQNQKAVSEMKNFEQQFFKLHDWSQLKALLQTAQGPLASMAAAGVEAVEDLQASGPSVLIDPQLVVERVLHQALQEQLRAQERGLSELATIGSISPFVGLFGTVWGIMHAFTGLASMQQVTLAKVAPGIAEALVATAIGLFAAIPAVLAYNRFSRDIERVAIRLDTFMEEFSNILQRNVGSQSTSGH